ncbi:MAG: hypothetical protein ACRDYZ_08375 [Acidimicrobiales bacterium]
MRTRIALAAASSVTFIGSTISLGALHAPAAAAATKAAHPGGSRHPGHSNHQVPARRTQGAAAAGIHRWRRLRQPLTIDPAELRTVEVSGVEAIGTYMPLLAIGHSRRGAVGTVRPARVLPFPIAPVHASPPAPVRPPAPAHVVQVVPAPVASANSPAAATFADNPAPTPAPAPSPGVSDVASTATASWQCIRIRESGDVYNDPSRPSGAYGILDSTWLSLGYGGWPYQAPAAVQDQAALTLYDRYGWQPWSSRFACGL